MQVVNCNTGRKGPIHGQRVTVRLVIQGMLNTRSRGPAMRGVHSLVAGGWRAAELRPLAATRGRVIVFAAGSVLSAGQHLVCSHNSLGGHAAVALMTRRGRRV